MNAVTITHGTEGPRHDPYAYSEIHFTRRDGIRVTLHTGLCNWIQFGDARSDERMDYENACTAFYYLTGYRAHECERFVRKANEARYRAHRAHGGFEWSSGFPGEELCFCKCGQVIDSTFNIGAII